jgi:predicted transposase YbfD/YdcC
VDKGHGRRERRTLISTTILCGYADWPGLAQVFRLKRERTVKGRTTEEVEYGISSLTRDQSDARRLLDLTRGHWAIENKLHYVRDVTLGEDACRVRKGSAPQVLAGLRNVVIHLLKRINVENHAAAIRHLAAKPLKAIRLIRPMTEN